MRLNFVGDSAYKGCEEDDGDGFDDHDDSGVGEVAGSAVGEQGHGDSLEAGCESIRNLRGQERELPACVQRRC